MRTCGCFFLLVVAVLAQDMDTLADGPLPIGKSPTGQREASRSPFTFKQRLWWSLGGVAGRRTAGYAVSAAIATARNSPEEYGPHWDGYARRVGERIASGTGSRLLEAGLGALWDEDPRYRRAVGQPVRARVANIIKLTFMARNTKGELRPAYARYIAVTTNSYVTNLWRPDSQATARDAALRVPLNFLGRLIGHSVNEFWPEITRPFR